MLAGCASERIQVTIMNTLLLLLAALETGGLISLLIWLVVVAVVVYIVYLIFTYIPLPEPIKTIILCVLGLILFLVVIRSLGFL